MTPVSLFIPCLVDLGVPQIGLDMVRLLRHLDCDPVYHTSQTCCGQVVYNSGYLDKARTLARRFIRLFENDPVIVSPSASCVKMVRHHYPDLFCDQLDWKKRAEAVAARTFELSEYITTVLGITDVGAAYKGAVAYHDSCSHFYGLEISEQPKSLLEQVIGIELVPLAAADVCCGFGGRFSTAYPQISTALVADKVSHFIDSGARLMVLGEPGCLLNINAYLSRHCPDTQALHLASFLAGNLSGTVGRL